MSVAIRYNIIYSLIDNITYFLLSHPLGTNEDVIMVTNKIYISNVVSV